MHQSINSTLQIEMLNNIAMVEKRGQKKNYTCTTCAQSMDWKQKLYPRITRDPPYSANSIAKGSRLTVAKFISWWSMWKAKLLPHIILQTPIKSGIMRRLGKAGFRGFKR